MSTTATASDRRSQLLEVAADLVQSKGWSAFSFQDLAEAVGIRKASIHHHFPTKNDLGLALTEHWKGKICSGLANLTRKFPDPVERLDAYLAVGGKMAAGGEKICPAGAIQSACGVLPAAVETAMHETLEEARHWMAELLEEGRNQGKFSFPGSAADQATFILAALQGALQHGRAEGPEIYRRIAQQVKETVAAK